MEEIVNTIVMTAMGMGLAIFVTTLVCYGIHEFLKDMGLSKEIIEAIVAATVIFVFAAGIIGGFFVLCK